MKLSKNNSRADIPVFLVINADDFGVSLGTNRGIERAHRKGLLTSTSIMPSGPAFDDAVKVARRNPRLGIGIHLSLTWGNSCLPKKTIPDLVDSDQYFYPSFLGLIVKIIFKKVARIQIRKEFEAQIQRVLKAGIKPDHLNGQVHVHFFPYVFPIVLSLAKKYKISYVRIPLEPLFATPTFTSFVKWGFLQMIGIILRTRSELPKNDVRFFGVLFTSKMTKDIIIKIVQLKENSIVEILSHPGEHNLRKTNFSYTRQRVDEFLLSKSRLLELIALTNKELLTYIKSRNFKLTTFAGLKS